MEDIIIFAILAVLSVIAVVAVAFGATHHITTLIVFAMLLAGQWRPFRQAIKVLKNHSLN